MEATHYVPIVLTRRGERTALRDLPAHVHDRMTPLFVVAPIDWDYEEEAPSKTIAEHIRRLPDELHAARGDRPALLDLPFLGDGDELLDNGAHPLGWLLAECPVPLIPVVAPSRSDAYLAATHDAIRDFGRGACIRLSVSEWPGQDPATFNHLLERLSLRPEDADLVLDLEDRPGEIAVTAVAHEITSLPNRDAWRSLTVAATSMPKQIPQGRGIHEIDRQEWIDYGRLLGRPPARVPTFGDYGVAHPDPVVDVNPRWMSVSANVRYTVDESWLVPKGDLFRASGGLGIGGAAVPPVLRSLQAQPAYLGAGHCALEDWVDGVLNHGRSGGNPELWRRHATTHHLTHVVSQIANLPGT